MERDDEMPEFVTSNSDDRCNTQYVTENEADKKNKDPMAGVHGISLSIVINSDGAGTSTDGEKNGPAPPNAGPENGDELLAEKLKEAFDGLTGCRRGEEGYCKMAEKVRVVVTLNRLLDLFSGESDVEGCKQVKEVRHRCEGGVLIVSWGCSGGHNGQWESSEILCEKFGLIRRCLKPCSKDVKEKAYMSLVRPSLE